MSLSAETRRARRARVSRLDPADPADRFALRDAIVSDPDAYVRSAAIHRLDAAAARELLPYLRDATLDPSTSVREAAFVGLARAGDADSLPRAARACRYDRGFRVRRMALLFAARVCGAAAVPVLAVASRDPFWRVRVAARRAGAALDAAVDASAAAEPAPVTAIPELDDADPAVVAARLSRVRSEVDPRALVGALGHSHQALRRIAVTEIAARGEAPALRAALRWLADERVPYGPAAAEAALARSGPRGAALALEVVEGDADQPAGVLAWAIGAATRAPSWPRIQRLLEHDDARVREAAATRIPEAAPDREALFAVMRGLLDDEDERIRTRAAAWLAGTRSRDAREALLRLDPRTQPTPVRSILVGLRFEARDLDGLRELSADAHGGVCAHALEALSARGALTAAERHALEGAPDPWVRRAVLLPERASAALGDASPAVRAAALDALEDQAARSAWACSAMPGREPDPGLRARAATILSTLETEAGTRALLVLARDADLGVRGAAAEALAARRDAVRRLLESGSLEVAERIAAYTLLRLGGEATPGVPEPDPRASAHLELLDDVLAGRSPRSVEVPARGAPPEPPSAHRELGRTGLRVHPFGLSGAHGLAFDDFALARERGVNLFFWEPTHRELGRFLRAGRGAGTVVVAGTYHADARSIERDVVRALRALRRETIDVFLAFWTRSLARIDEVAGVLRDLSDRGLIGATGLSTHDRGLACAAADRGLDVVMVRHSAAHRGAESSVLPRCAERATGVLTFSNLCYGRMLHRTPVELSAPVTAPDCYRYSLSQPGVHACIAAPRRHSELIEDLEVTGAPAMTAERQAELRAHGNRVYERSKAWSAETWQVAERPVLRAADEALSDWIERPESIAPDLW